MAAIRFFNIHRPWEDWVGMLLGMVIAVSPWLVVQSVDQLAMWNAIFVGAFIFGLAQLAYVSARRWEEIAEAACGVWLIASPFTFAYAGALRYWHFSLGAIVVLIAVLELWQDWARSDETLARRNQ